MPDHIFGEQHFIPAYSPSGTTDLFFTAHIEMRRNQIMTNLIAMTESTAAKLEFLNRLPKRCCKSCPAHYDVSSWVKARDFVLYGMQPPYTGTSYRSRLRACRALTDAMCCHGRAWLTRACDDLVQNDFRLFQYAKLPCAKNLASPSAAHVPEDWQRASERFTALLMED